MSGPRNAKKSNPRSDVVEEPFSLAVDGQRGSRLERELAEAAEAYDGERFEQARKLLAPMAKDVPDAAAVRELLGLTLYRLERFDAAIEELEAFGRLTGAVEQLPVLADCYRAGQNWDAVEALSARLEESPAPREVKLEGRIVAAGALADQGRLVEAIDLLGTRRLFPKHPEDVDLRKAYVLGDFYERAGDVARARQIFTSLASESPGFVDVDERISAL